MLVYSLAIIVVYSAYGDRQARWVSLLVKRALDSNVDLVHIDARSRLIVADIAGKNVSFWVVVVYAPNDQEVPVLFFRQLGLCLVDSTCLLLWGTGMSSFTPN